ncbi:MAG: uroporphyrinogen decarboxylase [Holosporaceae bacterium]
MLLLSVLAKKKEKEVPVWLMRQAGRYLPEYRKLRKENKGFLDLVFSPKKATEITLQPIKRFDFDAAILFSDILVIPLALGQQVSFEQGLELSPIDVENIRVHAKEISHKLAPIAQTVQKTRKELAKDKALIGFAGGPFTVALYMLQGTSKKGFDEALSFAYTQTKAFEKLLDDLTEATTYYLLDQIKAGVNAVQLFETWAALVPWHKQKEWLLKPLQTMIHAVRKDYPDFPVITYLKGVGGFVPYYAAHSQTTAVSLDSSYPLELLDDIECVIQGNLDPHILLNGGTFMKESVFSIKKALKGRPFIFNLGHGILKETPLEHVEQLMKLLRD